MIPLENIDNIENGIIVSVLPSLSYKIKVNKEKIENYIDGIESIKQAVYKILMTDRYKHEIYNYNYGIELNDLFGKPKEFVKSMLIGRIQDALSVDDRIKNTADFEFTDVDKTTLYVKFKVITVFGDINIDWEVNI